MKTLLPIVLVVFFSPLFIISSATAQDNDRLGVFFDDSGGQTWLETTQPYTLIPFHVILLEPSHEEGIHAWECVLEGRTGEEPALMVNWVMAGGAFNAAQFPALLAILNTPLPPAATVVLASGEVLVPDSETEILFYLHPYDFPSLENPPEGGYPVTTPLYAYGEDLYQPLGWTSGCEAEPLARINDDGEDPSWSLGDLPEELLFGYVPAGETVTRGFYLQNTGEVALSGQLSISGDGFRYCYLYNDDYPYGLWTSDTQWFRMEPGQGSYIEIRLESATDEGNEGALDLTLCGETTTIPLVMRACVVSPPGWDFGTVWLGEQAQQTFEILNAGGSHLEGQVTIPESCSGFAVVEGAEPFSLGHDATHYFTVAFNPVESGSQECQALVSAECAGVELVGFCLDPGENCWYYQSGNGPILGSVVIPGGAFGVALSGAHAYVADGWSGLQVIDISNPESPQIIGSVDTPDYAGGVALSGTHAFVADHNAGLQVIDITNPASPQLIGSVDTPGWAAGVALSEAHAYVADHDSGLQVIDITNPESPQIIGSVVTPGGAAGVALSGTHAYVADEISGLQVIDITNPASPQLIGSVDTPDWAGDVALSGTHAYVADHGSGLQVIDITNPESPQLIGSVDTPGWAKDVALSGTHAYVADGGSGLQVIDITNPASPQLIGSVDTPGWAAGVALSGTHAYVADHGSGLQVLMLQCDTESAVSLEVPGMESRLLGAYPNPFNPRTAVSFVLEHAQKIELSIFDLTGKRVAVLADRVFPEGTHSLDWAGRDQKGQAVASGTYLVRMVSDEGVATEKMMLIR